MGWNLISGGIRRALLSLASLSRDVGLLGEDSVVVVVVLFDGL